MSSVSSGSAINTIGQYNDLNSALKPFLRFSLILPIIFRETWLSSAFRTVVKSGSTVRVLCTVPTWTPSSPTFTDLHDLHNLRSRSLVFIHELLSALRAAGIQASYILAPSDLPIVLIRTLPADRYTGSQEAVDTLGAVTWEREKAFLTTVGSSTVLVVS
ncbi:hypothetical protein SISSUDRAFT_1123910 [Sistotremastrum suecicum HHB10207 ss-3]|uniref:Uncharacterized protein n=1 Tax=Sistotremastrum suecicum HHB10207 ss-3 TaxID=1314776 RepID=A0A166J4X4_9AGAM|nr:hypothetical protein SISSUDRAFT_1123910 [Sistotremastrum suecicum HHB10207 ss-3]